MVNLRLLRVGESDGATFGVLLINGAPEFVTLEEPWRDNQRSISCIPTGSYKVKPVNSPKFGNTYEVTKVPDRSHILFHAGNTLNDTQGCILLGMQFAKIEGKSAIVRSRDAMGRFINYLLGQNDIVLEVIDPFKMVLL